MSFLLRSYLKDVPVDDDMRDRCTTDWSHPMEGKPNVGVEILWVASIGSIITIIYRNMYMSCLGLVLR